MNVMSKSTRTVLSIIILCALLFCFVGCSLSKEAITSSSFMSTAEGLGLETADTIDDFASTGIADYLKSAAAAGKTDDSGVIRQADFLEFDTESNAQTYFMSSKSIFQAVSGNATETSVNGSNYENYSRTVGGEYMYICRVETTALYIRINESYKDDAKQLIDALGY